MPASSLGFRAILFWGAPLIGSSREKKGPFPDEDFATDTSPGARRNRLNPSASLPAEQLPDPLQGQALRPQPSECGAQLGQGKGSTTTV